MESYLECSSDYLIRHIRPHHSGHFTTFGFGHSDLFRRFFPTHNSRPPFKIHNSYWRLRSTDSIASVQARKLSRQLQSK